MARIVRSAVPLLGGRSLQVLKGCRFSETRRIENRSGYVRTSLRSFVLRRHEGSRSVRCSQDRYAALGLRTGKPTVRFTLAGPTTFRCRTAAIFRLSMRYTAHISAFLQQSAGKALEHGQHLFRRLAVSAVRHQFGVEPRMALSGVRCSWPILARSCDLCSRAGPGAFNIL